MLRKLGYIGAAIVIVVAVLVAVSRLLAPVLDKHRAEIEVMAANTLGMPVSIDRARVSWYQYQPVLTLDHVTLSNKLTNQPALQIDKIRVLFSIPQSLWQRKPVLSALMISGAEINIVEKPSAEFIVQGFPALGGFSGQPLQGESRAADMIGWLSAQPRIILQNIDVGYTNRFNLKRLISLSNLRLENSGDTHTISGSVILHQEVPTKVETIIKWQGSVADLTQIEANAYVFITGLSLAQWWKGMSWQGWHVSSGTANAKLWATWSKGSFQKIQSTFEIYGLNLFSDKDKSTHMLGRLGANIGWKLEGNQQIIAGDDIFIDLPKHLWPSTNFYVSLMPQADGTFIPHSVNIGYINIVDLLPFIDSSPSFIPDNIMQFIDKVKLSGELQNVSATLASSNHDLGSISVESQFKQISLLPWHGFPGIKDLSGSLAWDGKQGKVILHSNNTIFSFEKLFPKPLNFDQLTGEIQFHESAPQRWDITMKDLQVLNPDLAVNIGGGFTWSDDQGLSANMISNFTLKNANNVTSYLPLAAFSTGLNKWIDGAFLSGSVESGTVVLKGPLKAYPFDHGEGEFLVSGTVKNIDFRFAPDWPLLKRVNGKLVFAGREVMIDVNHAEMDGINIGSVRGTIPNLGSVAPSVLTVQAAPIATDFKQGLLFINDSPLKHTIGKMFAGAKVQGPLQLTLGLTVPLADPDKTQVRGAIQFDHTSLDLNAWRLSVQKLHGQLNFTEKDTQATGIMGELLGKPMTLNIATIGTTKASSTVRATVINNLAVTDLENWLKVSIAKYVSGATKLTTNIDFKLNSPINAHIESDLQGVEVLLQGDYAKTSATKRKFAADITASDKQPLQLKLSYAGMVGAGLLLENKRDTFALTGLNIVLGNAPVTVPQSPGLYISGDIKTLNWQQIADYTNNQKQSFLPDLTLKEINVDIVNLQLPGQTFNNAQIKVVPSDDTWDIDIVSKQAEGELEVPVKLTANGVIDGKFQRLSLNPSLAGKAFTEINSKNLPSINLTIAEFTYNNMPLGQVELKTKSASKGMSIETLTISSSNMRLDAEGSWYASGTTLEGRMTSANVSRLLESLGFDVHNFVSSKGKIDFQLSWNKAPYEMSLASMNGNASIDLGQGRIVEISQTSGAKMDLGRMLSIFSLQTIPRRLSLDFSDVFQKGYSFDSFRGDFKFTNGNAVTSNTRFEGPVAKVDIHGRIGLAAKDFDLSLSVTPYVTSSIPVAATLLTGQPVIGIAAWAVDKVISSGVSKATTYFYYVRGPWSDPDWSTGNMPTRSTSLLDFDSYSRHS